MKYELERLGPDNFEHLIQSLIRGVAGNSAIIYGSGADGQREAVIENADLMICDGAVARGRTVVQAKFKGPDTKQGDWAWLRKNLKDELEGFKEKSTTHPHIVPETFLFFTNIVLTPVLDSGIRDLAEKFVVEYKGIIPNIIIFGADDIRTMLDNNRDVARCYASFITPGDVLVTLHENLQAYNNEKFEDLIEYARQMFREDSAVRLEQAGSVSSRSINIRNVYTDLEAKGAEREIDQIAEYIIDLGNRAHKRKLGYTSARWKVVKIQKGAPECNIVLIGNAGQGKSTLCQYICQIYRATLLRRFKQSEPEAQSYFTEESVSNCSIPRCERFPVLINLKRYAAWINRQETENSRSVISYILFLINGKVNTSLSIHDFRLLLSNYPWVFLFDGLDEVPESSNRSEVLKQIQEFLEKDLTESSCDSLVICTSRPKGYDDAFSMSQYNHYELKDMSKPLCKRYIEKLLTYLEDNGDERDHYRRILHNALDDPMISKLMTTPLYTAIIVLLVKTGRTPPTKRYALFQDYYDIVVKRELQKELLPSLHDEYDWIMKLHAQIGFLLQTESETAQNAAAELSTVRCKKLIAQFLKDEEFEGELLAKSEDLYLAITNRLAFLSEVSGSDQGTCVTFSLRSLQEYFAAEWLISFDDEDKLSDALEVISISAYWRNVYLFISGYFAKHSYRKNMNEALFRICQRNNGDENHESPNPTAYRLAMQGSWLALDLLCDNLFVRPNDQRRYLNIAAELLDWEYNILLTAQRFSRLPSKLADIFLLEKVIPHIKKTKSADGVAFEFLWMMVDNGNEKAYTLLEDIIGNVTVPDTSTICNLLSIGLDKVGEKAIYTVYRWISEERFADFVLHPRPRDNYWRFLSIFFTRVQCTEQLLPALRQAIYRCLFVKCMNRRRIEIERKEIRKTSLSNLLVQKINEDDYLNELFSPQRIGNLALRYRPIQRDWEELSLSEYIEAFRSLQLNELAALVEFLALPSCLGLEKLLDTYRDLPEHYKGAFIKLIGHCNWLLREIANKLTTVETVDTLLEHYDSTYFEACLKKDNEIKGLAETADLVSITESNYWNEIRLTYFRKIPQGLLRDILSKANKKHIDEGFISFLYTATKAGRATSQELIQFGMHHFPLLFQSSEGVELALKLFDEVSLRFLISDNIEYPETLQIVPVYSYVESNRILLKIDQLAELGEEFLQVYALLPYLFDSIKPELLPRLEMNTMTQYYHAISATGNQAALFGCILRMLTGPISDKQKNMIWGTLLELLQINSLTYCWYEATESFSMEGKTLVCEAINVLAKVAKKNDVLFSRFEYLILKELEANPVEQNRLIKLSEIAHSDRHFL